MISVYLEDVTIYFWYDYIHTLVYLFIWIDIMPLLLWRWVLAVEILIQFQYDRFCKWDYQFSQDQIVSIKLFLLRMFSSLVLTVTSMTKLPENVVLPVSVWICIVIQHFSCCTVIPGSWMEYAIFVHLSWNF